jgi:hypothetical protein
MNDLIKAAEAIPIGEQLDLSNGANRKALAKRISADIDTYCATAYDDGHRNHLGASLIGNPCSRSLWYTFRWVYHHKFSGRMQRLFDRGKREEARINEWLRGIGFEVWEHDTNGEQFRVKGVMGHFGGSLDAIYKLPESYGVPFAMLGEDKTKGTGSGFVKLKENGIAVAAPNHFAQMSIYGKHYNFRFGLYCCVNKNDDDLFTEIVALDWNLAEQLERKAEVIITYQEPPPKFSLNEATFECKYCDFAGICHRGDAIEKNCRSCVSALAVDYGEWYCQNFKANIPSDFIKQGCNDWQSINEALP